MKFLISEDFIINHIQEDLKKKVRDKTKASEYQ